MVQILTELQAYHGSPYDFEKFSVEHIGSGEGAIIHGWGLYFALHKSTSDTRYTNRLNYREGSILSYSLNGKAYPQGTVWFKVINIMKNGTKDDAKNYLRKILSNPAFVEKYPDYKEKINQIISDIDNIHLKEINNVRMNAGQVFDVELPELDSYLDEDKEYVQQSKYVRDALLKLKEEHPELKLGLGSYTGEQIYDRIASHYGPVDDWDSKKKASLLLHGYGITGIQYVGGTDGPCVVIFDDNDIKILSKEISLSNNEVFLPDDERVEENPTNIKDIQNPSEELQLIAVNKDPKSIQYIENPTEKVQKIAVEKNNENIQYIKNPSESLQMEAIKNHPDYIQYIKNPADKVKEYILKNNPDYAIINFKLSNEEQRKALDKLLKGDYSYHASRYVNHLTDENQMYLITKKPEMLKYCDDIDFYDYVLSHSKDGKKIREASSMFLSKFTMNDITLLSDKARYNVILNEPISFLKTTKELKEDDVKAFENIPQPEDDLDRREFDINPSIISMPDNYFKRMYNAIIKYLKNGIEMDIGPNFISKCNENQIYDMAMSNPNMKRRILDSIPNSLVKNELTLKIYKDDFNNLSDDMIKELQYTENEGLLTALLSDKNLGPKVIDRLDNFTGANWQFNQRALLAAASKNKDYSIEMQRKLIQMDERIIKFLNLDEKIQMELVKKNPYNIKWINNPSQKVIDYVTKEEPETINYLRK